MHQMRVHNAEYLAKKAAYARKRRKVHKDKINAQARARRDTNKDKFNAARRERYKANKDKLNIKRRALRDAKKDEINAAQRAWYKAHRDEISAARRAYRKAHRDKINAQRRARREANRNKNNERNRAWYKDNKELFLAHNRKRRARKRLADGTHTAADTAAIRASQKNRCVYCRMKLGKRGHLDHIIPLSRGGSDWPRNLQWLCASCNLRKKAKDPIEFARENGMLV